MCFTLFSWKKAHNAHEKQQNVSLRLILQVQHQNVSISSILWKLLILGKIQDSGQDGGHLGSRHRLLAARQPIKCTSCCWAHHRFTQKFKPITADIYMPSIDKKGSVKTTTSGLKIDSLLVASSNLKLTRATKSWGLFLVTCDSSLT